MKIEGDWVYFDTAEAGPFEPKQPGDQYYSAGGWHPYMADIGSSMFGRFDQTLTTESKVRRPLKNCTPEQLNTTPVYEHYL